MPQPPIDAVITWVDGNDPVLAEKRAKYLPSTTTPGTASTRFASCDEILYCVLSLFKFAPFLRKIFIVTDKQVPPIMDRVQRQFPEHASKIEVIDHTVIFRGYEDCLPTFNSTSIGCMLHRIPGLSEQFVFFNDDMILARPITPEDFFVDGKPVLRGNWMGWSLPFVEWLKNVLYDLKGTPKAKRRLTSKGRMMTAARMVGLKNKTFISTHAPYAMRVSTRSRLEESFAEAWAANVSHRFRVQGQFLGEAIAYHAEIAAGSAVEKGRDELVYIRNVNSNLSSIRKKLEKARVDRNVKFLCIQNLDLAPQETLDAIIQWLDDLVKA